MRSAFIKEPIFKAFDTLFPAPWSSSRSIFFHRGGAATHFDRSLPGVDIEAIDVVGASRIAARHWLPIVEGEAGRCSIPRNLRPRDMARAILFVSISPCIILMMPRDAERRGVDMNNKIYHDGISVSSQTLPAADSGSRRHGRKYFLTAETCNFMNAAEPHPYSWPYRAPAFRRSRQYCTTTRQKMPMTLATTAIPAPINTWPNPSRGPRRNDGHRIIASIDHFQLMSMPYENGSSPRRRRAFRPAVGKK